MKTRLIPATAVVGWLCACAAADDYDVYAGLRYPGAKLRPDVEIYKVKDAGKGDPKAYERREVEWWPRKGVDIIDVREGMPLRTWTFRVREPASAPKQLQAHLVGFRGIGNTMGKFGGGPIEPAVVLRLPDGRKRCFLRGSFGEEDTKYIMDLYVKEMNRIKAGLDKTPRVKPAACRKAMSTGCPPRRSENTPAAPARKAPAMSKGSIPRWPRSGRSHGWTT